MIDMETLADIDTIVCRIANYDVEKSSQSYFLNEPMLNIPNTQKMETQKVPVECNAENIITARSYEMNSGALNECYSILANSDNSAEIFESTEINPTNDIIIIISDDVENMELTDLYNKFRDRLKLIIYYGNRIDLKGIINNFSNIISVGTLKKAVDKSYSLVQNGQTILFPRIEINFDFFKYVSLS